MHSLANWNKVFEITWRILVFIVAIGIIVVVTTDWTRWEGGAGWQRTNDAYLQADITPISAKVAGYVRELPIQDFERVYKGQVLAQLVEDGGTTAVAVKSAAGSVAKLALYNGAASRAAGKDVVLGVRPEHI